MPWTLETLEQMDLEASRAVFAERFADAADFSFLFVGNVDLETLEPLVERYLGSLPAGEGREARGDDGARRVTGVHREVVHKGIDPQAQVRIRFHGPIEESWEARNQFYTLTNILAVLLREELREELGGVYGVGVSGNTANHPEPTYTVTLSWGCDPERVDELKAAAFAVIERMRTEAVEAKYVSDEQAKSRRSRQKQLEENGFWMSSLSSALSNGWDPLEILNFAARVDTQSVDTVLEAAQQYLNIEQYIEVVLLPETAGDE
jgi:zinc protease